MLSIGEKINGTLKKTAAAAFRAGKVKLETAA
jgi:hypothetical protein